VAGDEVECCRQVLFVWCRGREVEAEESCVDVLSWVFGRGIGVEEGGSGGCCGGGAGVGWSGEDGSASGRRGSEEGEVDGVAIIFCECVGLHLEDVD